jgi:hypothetical protein
LFRRDDWTHDIRDLRVTVGNDAKADFSMVTPSSSVDLVEGLSGGRYRPAKSETDPSVTMPSTSSAERRILDIDVTVKAR